MGNTKRYLQVELIEQAEKAADNVFNILQGKRQFIADNYLSLKAYSIAAADKIQDYRESGKGLALSSIGDLLVTVGALGAVKAPAAEGLGMGVTPSQPSSPASLSRSLALLPRSTASSTSSPPP